MQNFGLVAFIEQKENDNNLIKGRSLESVWSVGLLIRIIDMKMTLKCMESQINRNSNI